MNQSSTMPLVLSEQSLDEFAGMGIDQAGARHISQILGPEEALARLRAAPYSLLEIPAVGLSFLEIDHAIRERSASDDQRLWHEDRLLAGLKWVVSAICEQAGHAGIPVDAALAQACLDLSLYHDRPSPKLAHAALDVTLTTLLGMGALRLDQELLWPEEHLPCESELAARIVALQRGGEPPRWSTWVCSSDNWTTARLRRYRSCGVRRSVYSQVRLVAEKRTRSGRWFREAWVQA